mmetsp:Transcript_29726/g.55090  ORF Transcript_29726/g.55090 Transcript_29726/m.55090 type:complete len:385 (+) Transcript_29726:99-1253(+)
MLLKLRGSARDLGGLQVVRCMCSGLSRSAFGKVILSLPEPRSIGAVFPAAVAHLNGKRVPDPETSARYLISQATNTGYSPAEFSQALASSMLPCELERCASHIDRRASREPVQYIMEDWEFCGMTFQCRAPVLIPRPETEELVDLVLASLGAAPGAADETSAACRNYPWRILDVGAGSGVLGVSLLAQLPRATCTALDPLPAAVSLARLNADRLLPASDHRYRALLCDIQEFASRHEEHGQYDLIVSNPPYIPSLELQSLEPEVVQFESHLALHGGADGLSVIADILRLTPPLLTAPLPPPGSESACPPGGQQGLLWLEVSHTHPREIERLVEAGVFRGSGSDSSSRSPCSSYEFLESHTDLFEQPRFVKLAAVRYMTEGADRA